MSSTRSPCLSTRRDPASTGCAPQLWTTGGPASPGDARATKLRWPHDDPSDRGARSVQRPPRAERPRSRPGGDAIGRAPWLGIETLLVLGVSLGASAVGSVLSIIEKLTRPVPLSSQTTSMNNAQTPDRPWLDLAYQLVNIALPLVAVLLAIYLLNRIHRPSVSMGSGRFIGFDRSEPAPRPAARSRPRGRHRPSRARVLPRGQGDRHQHAGGGRRTSTACVVVGPGARAGGRSRTPCSRRSSWWPTSSPGGARSGGRGRW